MVRLNTKGQSENTLTIQISKCVGGQSVHCKATNRQVLINAVTGKVESWTPSSSLAEQPRSIWTFLHEFPGLSLYACVLRSHGCFTLKNSVRVLVRKVRIFFVGPASREIECRSTTKQQH